MKQTRLHLGIVLLACSLVSLGFIVFVDRFFFHLLGGSESSLAVIAKIRLPSLLIALAAYQFLRHFYSLDTHSDNKTKRRTIIMGVIWLSLTAYFVLVKKVWVPQLSLWTDYCAFMITGLLAEEILFRGILFDLSDRFFSKRKFLNLSLPVIVSSVFFGLQHLAYHSFQITPASVTQVAYTTIMGIVFGSIKESTGKLWPVIGFHMLNNVFTLIRNLN